MKHCLLLLSLLAACASMAGAKTVAQIVAEVDPAVVTVHAGHSNGSGFIISPQGYVLTNFHVIKGAEQVRVVLLNQDQPFICKVALTDEKNDIAVLQLPVHNLPVIAVADSGAVKKGQKVVAIGSPLGLDHSPTDGIISGVGVQIDNLSYLQTSAALNPGNSGGPLLNDDGKVIGMNTMIEAKSQGIGFAIPTARILSVLDTAGIGVVADLKLTGIAMRTTNGVAASANTVTYAFQRDTLKIVWYSLGGLLIALVFLSAITLFRRIRRRRRHAKPEDAAPIEGIVIHQQPETPAEPDIEIELH